jgi:polysaccharide biosynthesis transport protein
LEIRPYLEIIRRRLWFIVGAVAVVAIAAGVASGLRAPIYVSTARVFLQPGDPAEQLSPNQPNLGDPNRFVQAQMEIVRSEAVAQGASTYLPGMTARDVQRKSSVTSSPTSDVLEISASAPKPGGARDIANAVAKAYIENRRVSAVATLTQAAKDLSDLLAPLQATIADLDTKIAAASKPGEDTPDAQVAALKSSRDAAATQYQTLYARQQELAANVSLQRGAAEVIAAANTPSMPVSPRPVRDAAAGAFLGLLVGTAIALLMEQLDDRIRSVADVERGLGLPILARLPFDEQSAQRPDAVAAIAHPHAPLTEAARALRTSLQYKTVDGRLKTVVVTSAMPSEGKSVVCANLAAVCAQAGLRTVLVEADLRRPGLSALFGISATPGLVDAVAGLKTLEDDPVRAEPGARTGGPSTNGRTNIGALIASPIRNLGFLPAGPIPPNPAELLCSPRMSAVLGQLTAAADLVIIDTPPLLPVTDAAVLGALVDGVILVVAMDETRRASIREAIAILEGAKVPILGVVINKAPKTSVPYYYTEYARTHRGRAAVAKS